ncbi:hypothetical protein UFOVP104_19 [uncultured Caudovirales phage]|uniref:Uncharacterized protein n=1 Tax=uncultured Caudovirales phage TaxID=2100421 RepID=A0A6J5LJP4_9CAUD|nr:hypothetical protein UFOVP104_19 [uncultured Caudovirales phage]CAB4134395.1 hypothetical protein UFOVP271_54 [uncultured Caudovirales phage]
MAKAQLELDDLLVNEAKRIALLNGLNQSKQSVTTLVYKSFSELIKYLDDESFEQITGLKK